MVTVPENESKVALASRNKTILVIDDEKDTGRIMSHIFGDRGDRVMVSPSGKEGLRKFRDGKDFDLVFLDVKLPDANGLDILRQIKQISPKVKVIIITAFGSPEARQGALERGASAFLDKPIQIEEMLRLAEEVLSKS